MLQAKERTFGTRNTNLCSILLTRLIFISALHGTSDSHVPECRAVVVKASNHASSVLRPKPWVVLSISGLYGV